MQANRARDTKPELAIRRLLHAMGLRYRVAARPRPDLRRRADVVFSRKKVAVFVDGCFWHGCPDHFIPPRAHPDYWSARIAGNRGRDRETDETLRASGWTVVRAWEHQDPALIAEQIRALVKGVPPASPL
jgi:DNA mismatch endonuclease (patch repair protein)